MVVDELVDGKPDVVVEQKHENLLELARKRDIKVGPGRKPENRVEPSRKPDNRGKADNRQDLNSSGKFVNHKLVDGKYDNLDERGADEEEKAQEVSGVGIFLRCFNGRHALYMNHGECPLDTGMSVYVLIVKSYLSVTAARLLDICMIKITK